MLWRCVNGFIPGRSDPSTLNLYQQKFGNDTIANILSGTRDKAAVTDFSEILPEDLEEKVKEAAEVSMGTEISEEDILNIHCLCEQVCFLRSF